MSFLGIDGLTFDDLYTPAGLHQLHLKFLAQVEKSDHSLSERYAHWRAQVTQGTPRGGLTGPQESQLLIEVAGQVSSFVGRLFKVENELSALRVSLTKELSLFEFKREFVNRRVFKKGVTDRPTREQWPVLKVEVDEILKHGFQLEKPYQERPLAEAVLSLMNLEKHVSKTLDPAQPELSQRLEALKNALEKTFPHEGATDAEWLKKLLGLLEKWMWAKSQFTHAFHGWSTVQQPHPLVFDKLVPLKIPDAAQPHVFEGPEQHLRRRDGFKLTDTRADARYVMGEVDYCVICHEREKDSCSKGFKDKEPTAKSTFKPNPLGIPLAGCPLDERISEMHALKARGDSLGALAMVMLDNPMCPGTGHRICNDCMKACIFQKQEPVNIPQIETSALTDVLKLPYGFEIYGLLTRWNPLHAKTPHARPYNDKNVLVVGLGPAGYTLSHYLMNEGFGVVGIDGLKIETFPDELTGKNGKPLQPLKDWNAFAAALDERILEGFGGVSEYGITVRWDKTFLSLIHLTLARRQNFKIYGGIRFGGTLTIDDAWDLGFHHIAIAAGAGKPTLVPMKNNLLRGMRAASDFLMALQLSGAFKKDSLSNLQVRLPAVVIGGGLTGVDTATELFAYYPVQVEKTLTRHEFLKSTVGEDAVFSKMNAEELVVYQEFLQHGVAIKAERARAAHSHEAPNFVPLVRAWGGVSLCYRRSLQESPAYRLNHEEVAKALEEGIRFVEHVSPVEAMGDEFGAVKAVRFETMTVVEGKLKGSGQFEERPARTVCVAAGTSPNTTYEREYPKSFSLDADASFFKNHDVRNGVLVEVPAHHDIGKDTGFFTSYQKDGRFISFYGDNHPTYAGNVVKAMASAKDGYPHVVKLFANAQETTSSAAQVSRNANLQALYTKLDAQFLATIEVVNRLSPTIVEVVVKAPFAAQHFEPGQFYRLQNFERSAAIVNGTRLVMEGLALTGAWVDKEKGLMSTIVLEMGVSSRLCATLRKGERVILMGPTGTPTHIAHKETVLLAGGGLGNAVLFSIGQALRAAGCQVLYFAGYRKKEDAYKFDDLEAAADQVIWAVDSGEPILPRRPQDRHFVGNIVKAMKAYATGELNSGGISLSAVDRVIAIGSDKMMRAVKESRHTVLKEYFKADHCALGSINSPMQCMMKEICAQCLQRHVDPRTGKESFVFSCYNQDQDLDSVDFVHLDARLRANSVVEKQTDVFLNQLLLQAPALKQI
jgi:NADPH-dependent glutamate synthase beta subunit-like oxidoreductase/NAD(P)H-flavin reductase